MKIIALEEHFVTGAALAAWAKVPPEWADVAAGQATSALQDRLKDLGAGRIAAMDQNGIDVQVLSLTAPAAQSVETADAVALAHDTNDLVAEAVRAHPDRLQAFATLATPDPKAAAKELSRAVAELGFHGAMTFGRTRATNLDDAAMWPIFEAAAHHRAPLYLHPQAPTLPVREQLYGGFGDQLDGAFATFGIGWHYEAGVQLLRLILAGVFDRFPNLQVITGHWGEVVLFYLDRIAGLKRVVTLERDIPDYFRTNISVTPSGMWSQRYFRWALEVVGAERILFSTDYPYRYSEDDTPRRFLADASLNDADREKIAHGNWERLVADIRR